MSKVIKLTESDIQHIVKKVLKEQHTIPMDTAVSQTGDNIKIYSQSSGEEGGTYTVDAVYNNPDHPKLSGSKSLDVLAASLNNNIVSITIMVPYGAGEFVEPILEEQETEMAKGGRRKSITSQMWACCS